MNPIETTLDYYNEQADSFANATQSVDFSDIQSRFIAKLPKGGHILDFGCGAGRDTRAFIHHGFRVTAVDGSEKLCHIAEQFTGQPIFCTSFSDYVPQDTFDGIWACASLLHLPTKEISVILNRLTSHLSPKGCLYASFKYGNFSGMRGKRYFTDLNETSLAKLLATVPTLTTDNIFLTQDVRLGRESECWLNVFAHSSK